LALKWVYENAERFGGDKTRITLGGQSAGSWSVGYHLMYEKSWPYFRNAILGSGNPLELGSKKLFSSEEATNQAINIGKVLGCFDNKSK
jgi:carboxylesterase type B